MEMKSVERYYKSDINMNSHLTHRCQELIKKFNEDPLAYDFREPVINVLVGEEKDEYKKIIERPMDLKTLKNNLDNKRYETPKDFYKDFRLIFENAILYHQNRYPLLVGISKYLLKKLEKEYKAKFEKSSNPALTIAYLYANYLQILNENTQNSPSEVHDIYKLGKMFSEPSLKMLSDKLNSVASKENFAELCEIIGKSPNDEDLSIEISELTKEQTDKLWEFAKKYDKPKNEKK